MRLDTNLLIKRDAYSSIKPPHYRELPNREALMIDLSPILRVVGQVRNRVRLQNSLEWFATATVVGLLIALASIGLGRLGVLSDTALTIGVISGLVLLPVGLVAGLFQPVSPIAAAKRIDLSHGLKDRFSSALDFSMRTKETSTEKKDLFEEFSALAMKEAVSFAGEVKPSKAAPLSTPKDLALSFALAVAFAMVSMLKLPSDVVATQPKPLATLTPVLVDSFDLEQQKEKAKQLLQEALEDGDKKTAEIAEKLLNLWSAVERGEMTQEAALRQLAAIEKELADAAKQKESLEQTAGELSKAFEKNKDTKELANALKNKDFEKAAQELEKLADKLDQMSQKDREELQKALEEAAKLAEEIAKEQKRELDDPEEQNDEEKTPEEREQEEKERELDNCAALDLATATKEEIEECEEKFNKDEMEERRRELEEDKRELEKLRRENKEKQEQQEKKREAEKLAREMKKAAEDLEKKLSPEQKEALKKAAEEMKKMGQKQRYAQRQQKAAGKIGDAKNVIIRGGKGKNGQAQNFRDRAGQKGQGQKGQGQNGQGQEGQEGQGQNGEGQQPGDGQGEGQEGQNGKGQGKGQGKGNGQGDTYVIDLDNPGQGDAMVELPGLGEGQGAGDQPGDQPGGQGENPGGDSWGNGSKDPFGKETDLNVKFKEERITGKKGAGPSKVEVIEKVAQEGLVGAQYKKVYKEATREAEDSLEREQVPVGYKRFTKRYFDLIQPQ
jgi:hypothetical protein